ERRALPGTTAVHRKRQFTGQTMNGGKWRLNLDPYRLPESQSLSSAGTPVESRPLDWTLDLYKSSLSFGSGYDGIPKRSLRREVVVLNRAKGETSAKTA
ncbi:hypothetical protein, partial [Mesorhizobium sp. M0500]|uniref:hypothetical protein n=1 Tax=Mesorhizobium sp. M0500 TaxID=2956953 RepID=UPI0033365352